MGLQRGCNRGHSNASHVTASADLVDVQAVLVLISVVLTRPACFSSTTTKHRWFAPDGWLFDRVSTEFTRVSPSWKNACLNVTKLNVQFHAILDSNHVEDTSRKFSVILPKTFTEIETYRVVGVAVFRVQFAQMCPSLFRGDVCSRWPPDVTVDRKWAHLFSPRVSSPDKLFFLQLVHASIQMTTDSVFFSE